jgi:AmmeMemoRadiSam system protein B/AmmeMemoRadiSam system protein A
MFRFLRAARAGRTICTLTVGALIAVVLATCTNAEEPDEARIRPPAVAGGFYPGDPDELGRMVDDLLDAASRREISGRLIALVSPHAGYVYSGHVAAEGYALLRGRGVERVVVISPSHVEAFEGASVYEGDAYATPLGNVPVDIKFCERLAGTSDLIKRSGRGHDHRHLPRGEHALEVQLPFLQRALGEFRLVPVVMGQQDYETCRAVGSGLSQLVDDTRTIVIASSDLSHFHGYDEAVRLDRKVLGAIERWDYYSLSRNFATRTWEACGGGPIVAAMIYAEREGASDAMLLKYANSGDVAAGDKNRVVGYSAFALVAGEGKTGDGRTGNGDVQTNGNSVGEGLTLTPAEKERLLTLSRRSVETAVREGGMAELEQADSGTLSEALGAFVTLTKDGQLRGCIGYVVPTKPLQETVRDVAAFAAVRDRRFPPVSEDELSLLEYEVSVLSPMRRVTDVEIIEVGKHGLLIKRGQHEGLLLPQVATDNRWDRITFLQQTCRKAGLPPDAWRHGDTDIFSFTALVFGEHPSD